MTILDSDSEDNIEDDSVDGNYLIQEYSPTDDRWSTLSEKDCVDSWDYAVHKYIFFRIFLPCIEPLKVAPF